MYVAHLYCLLLNVLKVSHTSMTGAIIIIFLIIHIKSIQKIILAKLQIEALLHLLKPNFKNCCYSCFSAIFT